MRRLRSAATQGGGDLGNILRAADHLGGRDRLIGGEQVRASLPGHGPLLAGCAEIGASCASVGALSVGCYSCSSHSEPWRLAAEGLQA